jgi:YD repeat-containing protein
MNRPHPHSREKLIVGAWRMLQLVGLTGFLCLGESNARADITIGTGKLSEEVVDYTTGGEDQLAFIRYFYSLGPQSYGPLAPLGMNWRSNYDNNLVSLANSAFMILERPDGQVVRFKIANGVGASDDNTDLTLVQYGDTWVLKDKDGTEASFGRPGREDLARIVSIKAPNGYIQTLSYSAQNQLTTVTDSHDRRLAFTYVGSALSTVTTPDGLVLSYAFDSERAMPNYRLASVHYSTGEPQKNRSYLYEHQTFLYEHQTFRTFLTGVLDGDGKRLATWTYDGFGRCISSQRTGDADSMKVRYDMEADGNPVNTVTNSLGEITVYKFKKFQGDPKVVEIDRVASPTRPATAVFFAYDASGHLVKETDAVTSDSFRPQFKSP